MLFHEFFEFLITILAGVRAKEFVIILYVGFNLHAVHAQKTVTGCECLFIGAHLV